MTTAVCMHALQYYVHIHMLYIIAQAVIQYTQSQPTCIQCDNVCITIHKTV
jgi:hypothetical protein